MGCNGSKDAPPPAAAAPAAGGSHVPSKSGTIITAKSAASDALKNLAALPTMINHAVVATGVMTGQIKAGAHHLKNVFASPLLNIDNFTAPVHPKTHEEQLFIEQAVLMNFVFSTMSPREMKTMIAAFEKVHVPNDDVIIQQGDQGDYFYVLLHGQVRFEVNGKEVGTAKRGHCFGELSLLYTCPRAASAIAITNCTLFRVDQTTFRYILQTQTQQADKAKIDLLRNISFLKDLDPTDLNKLVGTMRVRPFNEAEYIFKKGEVGDAFYVIQEGKVKATNIEVGGQPFEDQVLGPGDFFGERALVTKEPRAANCIGVTKGIALSIDSDTFSKVMGNLSQLVIKATDKRTLAALKIIQHTHLDPSDLAALADLIVDDVYRTGYVIFTQGEQVDAAFYLVRKGRVHIKSADGKIDKDIGEGGYFGEDMLAEDAKLGSNRDPVCTPAYTVTVLENCTLGCLSLEECRTMIDTTLVGKGKTKMTASLIGGDADIKMSDLQRHKILGAGTFGQVWLVSRSNRDGIKVPYALKVQSKYELIQNNQASGVVQEKDIMAQLKSPFIIRLVHTYQDSQRVYMLLGLVQGGELYSVLHKSTFDGVPEKSAKFYGAGILEGLSFMHRRRILYRDLKPENVLIDAQGYPVIVDLGFAKYVVNKTYTLCGTPLYIAPEVVLNRGHDKGADHWSLGVLLYEMIAGFTPFYKDGMDQISLFRAIVKGDFTFPKSGVMSSEAEDLILRMLVVDPSFRLGSLAHGQRDLYRHEWFRGVSFERLKEREYRAPWVPKIKDPLDTANFENWDHLVDKTTKVDPPITPKENKIFASF